MLITFGSAIFDITSGLLKGNTQKFWSLFFSRFQEKSPFSSNNKFLNVLSKSIILGTTAIAQELCQHLGIAHTIPLTY